MSREYDLYLQEHKANVKKGFDWIKANLPILLKPLSDTTDLEWQIGMQHDFSKNDPEEYNAYDAYFYGGNRSYEVVQNFNYAWLRHIHNNPHHWQHWVLNNDDPEEGEIIMDMLYNYIIEMICDWWSFSWANGDLTEIFKWYDEHKDYMKLSPKTRETVEDILNKIEEFIEVDGNEERQRLAMIDWNVAEKNKQFEESLRDILDDIYYESINKEGTNANVIKELAIRKICLLHGTHMKCLTEAISNSL